MLTELMTAAYRAEQLNQHLRDQLLAEDQEVWVRQGIRTGLDLDRYLANQGLSMNWRETEFSGDSYRHYEAPALFRWSLSVNRYGKPRARLFLCGDGGGPGVMETDLPFEESENEETIMMAAREWARLEIESGEAVRRFLFPTAFETPVEVPEEETTTMSSKFSRKEIVFPGDVEIRLFIDEDRDVRFTGTDDTDHIDCCFNDLDEVRELGETLIKLADKAESLRDAKAKEFEDADEELKGKLDNLVGNFKSPAQIAREHLMKTGVWSTLSAAQMKDVDPDFDPLALQ